MADRRKLLDTGKEKTKSLAGTIGSLAGTVASKGKAAAKRAASGVREEYQELTDDTVTDQERARLERAEIEARREARQEARKEFREEFRENVFDEAYDRELQQLKRRAGIQSEGKTRDGQEPRQQTRQGPPEGMGGGMAVFGVPQAQRGQQRPQRQAQTAEPLQPQNTMVFGGFAAERRQDVPAKTEELFGVTARGTDDTEQRAPLFGFPY